jgi:hypothetical protein
MKKSIRLSTALLALAVAGCSIGYNQTLFVTSSNVGLNVDTKPPVAEISIARREGVIAPTFERGQHPPVYASFGVHAGGFLPLTSDTSGLFAGGDAAEIVSTPEGQDFSVSRICLAHQPTAATFGDAPQGEVRPMFFGTDTSYGVKIAWTGTAGPYPDSVKLGYNRTEFALAPLTLSPDVFNCPPGTVATVRMPSFLASINAGLTAKGLAGGIPAVGTTPASGNPEGGGGSQFSYTQFFATGASAENLAKTRGVKDLYKAAPTEAVVVDDVTQKRKVAINAYVRDLAKQGDKATLDSIAKSLGLVPNPDIMTERNDILFTMDVKVVDKESMDKFCASLGNAVNSVKECES